MKSNEKDIKPIIYEIQYGYIKIKLDKLMKNKNLSIYDLSTKANIRYQTLQALLKNESTRIDFEVLARLCYSLDCNVEDIIEYMPNKESKE